MEISALRIRWVSNETGVLAIGAPVRRRQARLQLRLVGIAPPVDGSLPAHEAFTLRTGHALDFLSLPYCAKSALRPSVRTETEVRCQVPRLGSAFCFYPPANSTFIAPKQSMDRQTFGIGRASVYRVLEG